MILILYGLKPGLNQAGLLMLPVNQLPQQGQDAVGQRVCLRQHCRASLLQNLVVSQVRGFRSIVRVFDTALCGRQVGRRRLQIADRRGEAVLDRAKIRLLRIDLVDRRVDRVDRQVRAADRRDVEICQAAQLRSVAAQAAIGQCSAGAVVGQVDG